MTLLEADGIHQTTTPIHQLQKKVGWYMVCKKF